MLLTINCPAKVNLFLHILGKRADNYHILESLVTFADYGDELSFEANSDVLSLDIIGEYAQQLSAFDSDDNLIMQAARMFEKAMGVVVSGKFILDKKLPIASGIGGGSSNAAMAVKLLMQAYDRHDDIDELLLKLGADVPVCFNGKNVIMYGIGEGLAEWTNLPKLHAVLVNPNRAVSTAKIFAKLDASADVSAYDFVGKAIPKLATATDLVEFLKQQRNDMQAAAIDICPEISNILSALNNCDEVMFSQMSGSGATCFGVFKTANSAEIAARKLTVNHPNWWVKPTSFSG